MKLWIAREQNGKISIHDMEPNLDTFTMFYKTIQFWDSPYRTELEFDPFPEITFENSPQEVELKLCHQTETIKMEDCNPKAQPCVLTNHGIDTNVVKFD